ncbi:restriction endonuclease subunit S [Ligilactobacillus salivarius]|uniref:restriction endonuclease subunit S n=1 Tax=Ligilactobacillus salivarius TaxID=1624 RepID=UPI0020976CDD|nr:restriction endonuclease subunit S [Ligilactobacillus salivarius]MCO7134241.1 restriction endonuclease subunit S [Ligilactobacillus salivarius]
MMAKEEKKAPKLRFNGYTNDWERKKLGILITRVKSYPLSRSVEVKKETDVKYVHYGDIHTNIADEIDKNNNLPFINEIYKEYDELKLDDVIVADASEDYKGIADAAVIISNLPYTIIAGLHTIALRPTSLIKGYFLYHIFKTENFKRFGYKIGTGLKVFGISYNNLAKYKVYYPQKIEEQEKIIGILSNLTNSINLHERKCEELALIKKALLQKLFPKKDEFKPEVRYKNFSDAWEQRKLGEVATFINGRAYKQNELLDSGKYKVLRVGNFYTNDSWYYSNLELADKYYIDKGDLVYTWSATFGPHIWNGEKVIYHYHIWKIELSKFLDRDFTLQILEADKAKLLANTNGSTMIHVTKKDMESKVISLPNIEEQKKIGSYLMEFDSLITLHQRKLEKLKQLKKFLLQNMFI